MIWLIDWSPFRWLRSIYYMIEIYFTYIEAGQHSGCSNALFMNKTCDIIKLMKTGFLWQPTKINVSNKYFHSEKTYRNTFVLKANYFWNFKRSRQQNVKDKSYVIKILITE